MSGQDFEAHLVMILREKGWTNIRRTPATGDQGADILAEEDGRRIVIQAKRYHSAVSNKAIQEVVAALHFYSGDEGWVITNSTFTKSARELAQKTGTKLMDGFELRRFSQSRQG